MHYAFIGKVYKNNIGEKCMPNWKELFCDAFRPLGHHRTKCVMLVQLHMYVNEGCWEF